MLKPIRLALLLLLSAALASAGAFSYTGMFTYDDDMAVIPFTVTAYSEVTIRSWSFGGGLNAAGQTIPDGGFAPVLSLVYPDPATPIFYDHGFNFEPCPGCTVDPATGDTSDAFLRLYLDPGEYFVAITQYDNVPGVFWGEPFSRAADDNPHYFTEDYQIAGGPEAPFLYYRDTFKRTGNWAVDITGENVGPAVPEPASLALGAIGIVLLLLSPRWSYQRRS